jgi:aminopeptidase N
MRRSTLLLSLALAALSGAQDLPKQARDRHEYDLLDVDWRVRINPVKAAVAGTVVNTLRATRNAPFLVFDCGNLTVTKVTVDGKKTPFRNNGSVLAVRSSAKQGKVVKVTIEYRGLPEAGMYFVDAKRAFPAKTPIVYTQGEMEDNRYWLPTYDSPNDKATSRGTITVPKGWSVLSNGRLLGNTNGTWRWAMDKPHVTYLISLVAGPYTAVPDGTNPVPVSIWTPKGLEGWGKNAFGGTDAIIRFYGKLTGQPYPWAKYAQSAVADFMFGGMENVSATTQTINALFPDSVKGTRDSTGLDAHELAHQWFGDYVTTPRWDDIWINEGWATFLPHFWAREKSGQEEYDLQRYDTLESAKGAMREKPDRSMVWSGWKVPMDAFDGYAYPGGAARMFALMHKVGEESFWKATQGYLKEYGLKNVDTAQFFAFYSKALGTDLSGFEKQWFRTPSVPPTVEVRRANGKVILHQTQPTTFALDLDVWALKPDGTWDKRVVALTSAEQSVDLPGGPVLVDAEAFLPIDASYPDLTKDELIRMWKAAPSLATKMRLSGLFASKVPAEEMEDYAIIEEDPRMTIRLMSWVKDPTQLRLYAMQPNERVAQAALTQLGNIPSNADNLKLLREAWANTTLNPDLRLAALQSLYTLTKDPMLLDQASQTDRFDEGYRTWALDRLAEVDPNHAREVALRALNGGVNEPVRLQAIRILGRVKDTPGERTVFNALAAMMTERSNSPLRAAIGALADYGDKAAIPLLEKRKNHGLHFVRGDVANALERLRK